MLSVQGTDYKTCEFRKKIQLYGKFVVQQPYGWPFHPVGDTPHFWEGGFIVHWTHANFWDDLERCRPSTTGIPRVELLYWRRHSDKRFPIIVCPGLAIYYVV